MELIKSTLESSGTLKRVDVAGTTKNNYILSCPAEKRKYDRRIITDRKRECD